MTSDASSLPGMLGATAKVMKAELARIRQALSHPGEKGAASEEVVAKFLNEHMPGGLRATAGQIIDRNGEMSGQNDVIIYDAIRTPMLFTSATGQRNTVPAEGVLAVVEVKTKLTPSEVRKSVAHMQKVKTLVRDSYFDVDGPLRYQAYGEIWVALPIVYSIFAFEGDGLYADLLNDPPHNDLPVKQRIDNLVVLDRGVGLSVTVDPAGPTVTYEPLPTPASAMANIRTSNALAVWFVTLMSVLMQAGGPAINLFAYMGQDLKNLEGKAQSTTAAITTMRERVHNRGPG